MPRVLHHPMDAEPRHPTWRTPPRFGLARAIHIRCAYDMFGRELIKYTVVYGAYIQPSPSRCKHCPVCRQNKTTLLQQLNKQRPMSRQNKSRKLAYVSTDTVPRPGKNKAALQQLNVQYPTFRKHCPTPRQNKRTPLQQVNKQRLTL